MSIYTTYHEALKVMRIARAKSLAKRLKNGEPVKDIAESEGITRQRVEQLIASVK